MISEPMKHTSPEAPPGNFFCSNCHIMQFKIRILNAKLDELKAKYEASINRHTSNISKIARQNAKIDAKDVINWKTRCLHNVEHRIAAQNAALLKNCNEGIELEAVKQGVEKRFREKLEKQKIEVENALRKKVMEKKRQSQLNTSEIIHYEARLKKSYEENTELCYRWQRDTKLLEGIKFAAKEPRNFQRCLEEKLDALMKKFRNETKNSKTKVMTYVVNNFEAAMKVILSDEPNLYYLIKSNKDLAFEGNQEINKWDFKKFISKINFLLEKFYQKQEDELANNTSQIINRVEKMKQIMKRANDSNNILTMNEFMYRISRNMLKELKDMHDKFEILNKRINGMCQKIESKNDEQEELKKLIGEENKLIKACQKIDHEQQELELKLNRAELKYERLCRQIYINSKSDTILEGSSRENIPNLSNVEG
ncbi:unnamed protein product [Cercopithifilaria johnstoni]|uniref:Uncharacterized protein n=1 Tax=Cercopithifilaria johnstoni TaxID=2874296 RepID=A0A8J2MJX0_9BILA|nr:unnamed protein product [Cercopithifilaria johnstoni]